MKNYPEFYTQLRGQLKELKDKTPEVMAGFGALHKAAMTDEALTTKTKELIALAIAVAVRCDGCVVYHIADALRAGATAQEITEAIGVAVLMGGGPAAIYGAQALEALKQFEDHPKDWAIDRVAAA